MKFGDYEVSGIQHPGYGESLRGSPAQAHVCWMVFLPIKAELFGGRRLARRSQTPSSALSLEALLRHRRLALLPSGLV